MWGAILGGLASAIPGMLGARSAARSQSRAANAQIDLNREIYNQQREDFGPYREAGYNALSQYTGMLRNPPRYANGPNFGGYRQDPGYLYQLREGQKAIEGSAAASGGLLSGATLRSLQDHRQGMAAQDYEDYEDDWWRTRGYNSDQRTNYLGQLFGVAQMGQAAAGQTAAAAGNMGAANGNALASLGNAQAAGAIGMGNAITGGIQDGIGLWAYNRGAPQPAAPSSSWSVPVPPSRPW